MNALSLQNRSVLIMSAIFALVALVTGAPYLVETREGAKTECDTVLEISRVCYQCSRRHDEGFTTIYPLCCGDSTPESNLMREYCYAIYTSPPQRGGSWTWQGSLKDKK